MFQRPLSKVCKELPKGDLLVRNEWALNLPEQESSHNMIGTAERLLVVRNPNKGRARCRSENLGCSGHFRHDSSPADTNT